MELLELKSVWDGLFQETIGKESIDAFVVTKSIKGESKTVLAKIKRVMYLKFTVGGLSLVLCTVMLIGSFVNSQKFTFYENLFDISDNRVFLITIIIFMLGMLSWNFRAFLEIKRFETNTDTVKKSLKKFIGIMEKTIRLNIYSGVAFNSLTSGWVFYLINNKKEFVTSTTEIVLITALIMVLVSFLFYFISRHEQKLKFGKNVDTLKGHLDDMEE